MPQPDTLLTNTRSDRVKSVRALSRRSVRDRTGRFLVEGPQSVREVVRHHPELVVDLYLTPDAAERYVEVVTAASAAGLYVHEVTDEVLAAMSETPTPQGLAAVCRTPVATLDDVLVGSPRLLVLLTNVRDPGNAGTVIRGADAAGADAVLVSDASVDVLSPKVVRSTAGSLFHLPVVTGLRVDATITRLRDAGIRVLAADGAGTVLLPDVDLVPSHAWVMGNEAWGLEEEVRAQCDEVVRVPIYGAAESLNLAMAATVCVYASAAAQRG
ncbi:RNA methyltransferase [Phycicoccus sp. Root563]|uniref:TrmH family RNA methyltransferase n=1 Tax=Phycicoccus sp. Root563 TaxID=1736562 RepID=UPI000702A497|nr:RNA methyltransferase [Phycicoccus sp. Root563]KQZ87379.1 RNA methyltransferase [Phycicoccus sp. Root563]